MAARGRRERGRERGGGGEEREREEREEVEIKTQSSFGRVLTTYMYNVHTLGRWACTKEQEKGCLEQASMKRQQQWTQ